MDEGDKSQHNKQLQGGKPGDRATFLLGEGVYCIDIDVKVD